MHPTRPAVLTTFALVMLALSAAGVAESAPGDATERWRPFYHVTAARNWLNDPNGPVYVDGTYHLFYQYNPYGDRWGHMSWGHALSADLVHWRELPVAIPEDDAYSIFSGSIVVDARNSSGFAAPGRAPLVAVYTGARRDASGAQSQQLAYSNDRGRTWNKYSGNPVLDLGLHAFRDPKVFWYAPGAEWIMAAVLSDQQQVTFYGSKDLKAWRHLGDFGPAGAVDGAWECPDLFLLPVENLPGESRWVLKVDVFRSASLTGSGAQYFVGNFAGRTFTPEAGTQAREVDYGMDFYAAASWANIPARDGRHLWIAWMNSHHYAADTPTAPWRGAMTVPRSVALRRIDGGYDLIQAPVAELERLRAGHRRFHDVRVTQDAEVELGRTGSGAAEILATLQAGDAAEFGLAVRVGSGERTLIGYDVASQRLFVDRSRSGRVDFNARFSGRQWAPLPLADGRLSLRVLLDRSSLEVFAGDGSRVLTEQIFPAAGSTGLRAYARGGTAVATRLDLWNFETSEVVKQ